jgi:hypothetical protein
MTRMKLIHSRESQIRAFSMYFDDHERSQDLEGRNIFPRQNDENPWIISLSNEKRLAVEKFIGYNPKSASKLTDEHVEEETLRWVVDTDIVLTADDEDSSSDSIKSDMKRTADRQQVTGVKYDSIKDLLVASSCYSTLQSLTFLWNAIADALEDEISSPAVSSSQSSNSVKLIVFPKSESLWNYDTLVNMIEAIQIAQPLLPAQVDLRLDLFHPDYKRSPKMWSPHWHSPFPTVGLTIKAKKRPSNDELDIDIIRGKLDVLFQSGDATREDDQSSSEDHPQILEDCQYWMNMEYERENTKQVEFSRSYVNEVNIDWIVQNRGSPFQLYRTVWNAALNLSLDKKNVSIIIDPFLDSHTLHRVAVTVNAALKRLDIPVRITQVYHPFTRPPTGNCEYKTRPPHGMIQLSPIRPKPH